MAYLYEAVRLYVNFFRPSFKLIDKIRDGATTVKRYSSPATPCDRLVGQDTTGAEMRVALNDYRSRLDPAVAAPVAGRRGFSLSAASTDIQELPATLYHRMVDSLAYAA